MAITQEKNGTVTEEEQRSHRRYVMLLSLTALGVVYGDIGTSPLYALRECFHGPHAIAPTSQNVLGVLSLIFWALLIIISVKYLAFVMRADNRGEGGILALVSLTRPKRGSLTRGGWFVALGLFGAALLYGDGMITPAISVLSAIEGIKVATPVLSHYVIPLTMLVLIALFLFQRKGSRGIGAIFGPVMTVWFLVIAILGLLHIVEDPSVLKAVNPLYAVAFFQQNGWSGYLVLGTVFLVVTGGEALYADMGHFGRIPIRTAWFSLVLPALLLNYFGQGALLLHNPKAASNPFYFLAPSWALYPMVALATAATTIASQAVISGAFSLTRQAVQLGYCPRMRINHTSEREIGQIYIPAVNWTLMITTIGLVWAFRSSSNLAAAYGVAVTTTMVITTILLYLVARDHWGWGRWKARLLMSGFLIIDLAFFGANIIKLPHGGWFPLVVAAVVFTLMTTWRRGRDILGERFREMALPDELFLNSIEIDPPIRVPGTAVFMDRMPNATPHALLHNIKHNKILHERVVLLTVLTEEAPRVPQQERIEVLPLRHGLFRVILHYGFMEDADIPYELAKIKLPELQFKPTDTTYFLGRESLIATKRPGMAIWREKLFAWMSRNALSAAYFFGIPPNRVVELGAQVEL
jgi:KUP system potassium uptake protein